MTILREWRAEIRRPKKGEYVEYVRTTGDVGALDERFQELHTRVVLREHTSMESSTASIAKTLAATDDKTLPPGLRREP